MRKGEGEGEEIQRCTGESDGRWLNSMQSQPGYPAMLFLGDQIPAAAAAAADHHSPQFSEARSQWGHQISMSFAA